MLVTTRATVVVAIMMMMMIMMIVSVQAFHIPTNLIVQFASTAPRNINPRPSAATAAATATATAQPLFLSSIASNPTEDLEAIRYRNRSDLLEKTLRQKVQALKLSDQKLGVLQDAVKRVMAARTVEHQKQEQRHEQQQQANKENDQQQEMSFVLPIQAQAQVLEWKARYERAETARLEAVSALADVQRQYHDRKVHSVQTERDRLLMEMETLQKSYRNDQKQWAADVATHTRVQTELVEMELAHQRSLRQVELLQKELRETQQELASVRASIQQEQVHISSTLTETETSLQRERQRFQTLRAQWAEIRGEKTQLEQSHKAHAEAMLIAQASVAAAERREAALRRDLAALNNKYNDLSKANQELQILVEELSAAAATAAAQQQQEQAAAAAAAAVVDIHKDIGMDVVEDLFLDDPTFNASPYVVEQDEVLLQRTQVLRSSSSNETSPSKPSRLKRVALAVFGLPRRWREKRERVR